jgi:Ca-activated chloride channel homolog
MNFRFAQPDILSYLWLVPLLFGLWLWSEKNARARLKNNLGAKVTPVLTASFSFSRRKLKLFLRLLALTFFILAWARPQMGQSQQKIKTEGIELVIAFDVSTSMLAEDIRPSRLQVAKAEVARLLELLSGDKVGLVAFAGSSVLISPLTTDKSSLKMFIDSLSVHSVETQGTDIRKALREAKAAFDRGGIDPDEGARVTRAILLVSDGEHQEQGLMDDAKTVVNDGIRVFAMSVGTETGGPIPLRDERGYIVGTKRDKQHKEVITKTKGTVLRELAQTGKGSFYNLTFGGKEARLIKEDLDKLEKADFDSDMQTSFDEKYQIFLLIGLLLALFEIFLGERNADGRIWKGRFEVQER